MSPGYPSYIIDELTRTPVESVVLDLPNPPSANNLFANSSRGGRHKSKAYRAWLKEAGWWLLAQKPGSVLGPYRMLIEVARRDHKHRVDIGNLEKPVSDLLVAHHVVEDDSMAQEITLLWEDVEGLRVTVTAFQALTID